MAPMSPEQRDLYVQCNEQHNWDAIQPVYFICGMEDYDTDEECRGVIKIEQGLSNSDETLFECPICGMAVTGRLAFEVLERR